jgi:hypothetical protein
MVKIQYFRASGTEFPVDYLFWILISPAFFRPRSNWTATRTCALGAEQVHWAVDEQINFYSCLFVEYFLIKMATKGIETRLKSYKYNDRDQAVSWM